MHLEGMGTSLISKDACPEGGGCILIISGAVDPQGKGAQIFSHIFCSLPLTTPIATWHLVAKLNAWLGKVSWLNRIFLNKALLIRDFHVLLAFHVLNIKLINYTQRRKQVWGMENETQLMWYRKVQCVPFWFGLTGLGTVMVPVTWPVQFTELNKLQEWKVLVPNNT